MTYYGRWTYKYEMGAKKGAAGVLIVHETEPGRLSVRGRAGQDRRAVRPRDARQEHGPRGGRGLDHARRRRRRSSQMAGQDFDALKAQAATRDFKPVPLGVTASMTLTNTLRTIDSRNVVAQARGQRSRR